MRLPSSSTTPVVVLDRTGGILRWSREASDIFSKVLEHRADGIDLEELLEPAQAPLARALFERFLAGEVIAPQEMLIRTDKGPARAVLAYSSTAVPGSPLNASETNEIILLVSFDGGREPAAGSTEDPEQLRKEVDEFVYTASHDLQEPLRQILNFSSILSERYSQAFDEDGRSYMGFVKEGAERLQALLNDLLTYSRVTRAPLQVGKIDTGKVLETAIESLSSDIAETGAQITHGALPAVEGDEAQLIRLFAGILQNAIKFRSEQPPQIRVDAVAEDDWWRFSIKDNGIGFRPEYAEKIFQPFKRLHGRSRYPGTGIGLAVCKKIVAQHGGSLWAESEEAQGSVFYFTLRSADAG